MHHLLELLEIDALVTVQVDRVDHQLTVLVRDLLSECSHHHLDLSSANGTVAVLVEHLESLLQLVHICIAVRSALHHRSELIEANFSIAVNIELGYETINIVAKTVFARSEVIRSET